MNQPWSNLPNAHHIDWVLVSLKDNHKLWKEAWYAARDEAWRTARDAILALIAYDDCDEYLNMNHEELLIWAALSEHPAAVLLQPMVYLKERLKL